MHTHASQHPIAASHMPFTNQPTHPPNPPNQKGAMSFEDGLKLVKLRGESMQAAADAAKSGMVSVIGLNKEKVAELCEAATKEVRGGRGSGGGAVCISGAVRGLLRKGRGDLQQHQPHMPASAPLPPTVLTPLFTALHLLATLSPTNTQHPQPNTHRLVRTRPSASPTSCALATTQSLAALRAVKRLRGWARTRPSRHA